MKHFLFYVNCYLKTVNRKQQNTDNVLLLVENCDIKLEILNKSTHLNQSETQITVMSVLFFCESFSLVHIFITKIIIFRWLHSTWKYLWIRLCYCSKKGCHQQMVAHFALFCDNISLVKFLQLKYLTFS